jgi:hypothetical protein
MLIATGAVVAALMGSRRAAPPPAPVRGQPLPATTHA